MRSGDMSLEPDLDEQRLLEESFRSVGATLAARERLIGVLLAVGFFAACAALWAAAPPGRFDLAPALLSLLVLALATRVRFDTPLGYTVPTQLAFVPLLFTAPLALVAPACLVALLLAAIPDVATRATPASRLLQLPSNAWFSIGPCAVFLAAGIAPSGAGPWILLAALAAEFLFDFAASTVRCSVGRSAPLSSQLKESWVYGVDAGLSPLALVIARTTDAHPAAVLSLLPLLGLLSMFARERHRRLEALLELSSAYRGTALVLGDVVESDDGYTGQHCRTVLALSLEVGVRLGLSPGQMRNLEFGALLHDVGKIAIPKEIINNPGSLDEEEWALLKTHTTEGEKMLARVGGFMRQVGMIVRHHHERWDGGGYPDGIVGKAIPVESRIITCCDSWNAMRTDRVYRPALSREQALLEMRANSGSQFDPAIVQATLQVIDEQEPVAAAEQPPQSALPRVPAAIGAASLSHALGEGGPP